ncbi:MAG TPA: hypothetical protein VK154_18960 [Chitinophagales bacterium]|nr:hypothetical protein [Chitinophagales bacterium]
MKIKHKFYFLAFVTGFAVLAGVSSCKKDKTPPLITIMQPTDTTVVTIPDSIHIDISLAEEDGMHEMSIFLIDNTGDTAFVQYPYVHNLLTARYVGNYFPSVAGIYTLYVTASNHSGNSTLASRSVTVQ